MTETITSKSNPRLKEVRKLHDRKHRERTGLFLAEGEDMLAAALNHGRMPETVLFDPDYELPALPSEVEQVAVSSDALKTVGGLGSGSRLIGVWRQRWSNVRSSLRQPARRLSDEPPFLYLHDVVDPGNVGTILRAALAFGAGPVVLSPRTADPYSPKAVRAGMGALFGQPVARAGFAEARAALPPGGRAFAMVPDSGTPLRELDTSGPLMFALGSERTGLPGDVVAACDQTSHVPLAAGGPESLNVAMTATLCLYQSSVHRLSATDA
jgi:RNA methyltransferase, TrmH family